MYDKKNEKWKIVDINHEKSLEENPFSHKFEQNQLMSQISLEHSYIENDDKTTVYH